MARVRCTPAGGARICRCCSSACATGCVQACEVEQPSTSRAGEAHRVAALQAAAQPHIGRPQLRGSPRRPKVGAHQLSLHLPHSQLRKVIEQGVLGRGEGARPEVEDAVRSRQASGRRAGESATHFRAPPPGESACKHAQKPPCYQHSQTRHHATPQRTHHSVPYLCPSWVATSGAPA